jgi:hypothetical protein
VQRVFSEKDIPTLLQGKHHEEEEDDYEEFPDAH